MDRTLVIVDADPRTQRDFASASEAELVVCDSARAGLNACCAIEPAGVVLGSRLGDLSAAWVAQSIRSQPTAVASCAIIALLDEDDETVQLALLQAGVDVCIRRPKRANVLVAAVENVIAAIARGLARDGGQPTTRRTSAASSGQTAAMSGRVDDAAAMIALRQIESGRRTGELVFSAKGGRKLALDFASGVLVGGRLDEAPIEASEAIREALHWVEGSFDFAKRPNRPAPPGHPAIGHLLATVELPVSRRFDPQALQPPAREAGRSTPRARPNPIPRTGSARRETLQSQPMISEPAPGRPADVRERAGIRVKSVSRLSPPSRELDPRAEPDGGVIEPDKVTPNRPKRG